MSRSAASRSVLLTASTCLVMVAGTALADIDLLFSPATQTAPVGTVVEIDLVASCDDSDPNECFFAAIDAILSWDPEYLGFIGVDDSGAGYPFGPTNHFMPDPDGINDDLQDGDALFTALAQPGDEASAPPEGLVVTTLQFLALAETDGTVVSFLPSLGDYGVTRVRRLDLTDVTGDISATGAVTIVTCGTGDADADGDVDLADFAAFQTCYTGSDGGGEPICRCLFDFEPDEDVDFADFEEFANHFSGPLVIP